MNLENQIEAILLYKNEPVQIADLASLLGVKTEDIHESLLNLKENYKEKGLVIVTEGDKAAFGTNPNLSNLIEKLQKEELSKDIGKAGIETLSIILYKGPISRREIDYIRGVNSGYIIRNLLVRGLIEKSESDPAERSFRYAPTIELLRYLGLTKREDLPEFKTAFDKLEAFAKEDQKGEDTEL